MKDGAKYGAASCAKCGEKTGMWKQIHLETGASIRERRCYKCGYRFRTIEMPTRKHQREMIEHVQGTEVAKVISPF